MLSISIGKRETILRAFVVGKELLHSRWGFEIFGDKLRSFSLRPPLDPIEVETIEEPTVVQIELGGEMLTSPFDSSLWQVKKRGDPRQYDNIHNITIFPNLIKGILYLDPS